MPHPALTEALEVFEQRSLPALKLVLAHPLDRAHQVAQRAHERQRARVQRLDLAQQTLKQGSQVVTVRLLGFELPEIALSGQRQM